MAAATKGFQTVPPTSSLCPSLFLSFVPSFRDTKHEFRRTEGGRRMEVTNGGSRKEEKLFPTKVHQVFPEYHL